jgi:hypothetical protein
VNTLSKIAPRLKCLVLMLSSDRDGEVVNAARAIGRTLQSAGTDWHDLAKHLVAEPPHNTKKSDAVDWRVMHSFCLQRASLLNPREQQFINDLCRWRGALTSKQRSWLEAIHDRLYAA